MKLKTKLSIIIPVYNEIVTIKKILNLILRQKFIKKQIIIVDDCSSDGTKSVLKNFHNKVDKIIYRKKNGGKGAAIKDGLKYVNGDYVIIQDADLEYNPKDYKKLVIPIYKGEADVVYGSRVLGKKSRYIANNEFTSFFRIFANHVLTVISNLFNNQNLTDAHTCYKMFRADLLKKIKLKENDFSFCPEVTTKLSKLKIKIKEVPISYFGRSVIDGKKIKFIDAVYAIKTIIKYRFVN